ncbi:hypothetical protein [Pseudomonas carassii]|uniref:Uncharacterized protein n=1 Tax=Pseudomonas carassii TaxID=3115855 RepID=A0ABU7H5L1_9PSED|nr:hypothetical protein [Pseudomonas sp. 137P]MEE1886610.1 hypothetical protein [Pseudomonas sp. 137P]
MRIAWTSSGSVIAPLSGFDPDGMQVILTRTQLLSLDTRRPILARSISGTHWISWRGRDLLLAQGQSVVLHAGQALVNGEGVFAFAPSQPLPAHNYLGALRRWLKTGLPTLQPSALHIDIV